MPCKKRPTRAVEKPKRPSRSIETLRGILDANEWRSMITFKPVCSTPAETNAWMEVLYEMAKYALRGESVGFLIKREFGDDNKNAHFHMVFTEPLSERVQRAMLNRFLKREKRKNNQGRQFRYDCHDPSGKIAQPRLREYLKKVRKGTMDTIHPPKGWSLKELKRPYKLHRINSNKTPASHTFLISPIQCSVIPYNWREVNSFSRYEPSVFDCGTKRNQVSSLDLQLIRSLKFPRYALNVS